MGLITFVVLGAFVLGGGLIGYAAIAGGLPAPGELTNRASTFQSTRILRSRRQSPHRNF